MSEYLPALDDQAFMDALLDLVIPAGESGSPPSAGALGLSPRIAADLRADPMLGPMVEAGLEALRAAALAQHAQGLPGMTPQSGVELIKTQASASPFLMMGLLRYLYPAYYQHPEVLVSIGQEARPPFPEGYTVEATDAALLEKLQARRKTR